MQWLIDLLIDWIHTVGTEHDRGDPATGDWVTVDLTADGAWHMLDLSSVVPAGVHTIYLFCRLRATAINKRFELRTYGNTNIMNISQLRTQVANIRTQADIQVFPDSQGRFEYWLSPAGVDESIIIVKGWAY